MADTSFKKFQDVLAGRYAIERELGRGGMAIVYLANDLRHDRTVAIKLLQPDITSALTAERFLREIRITARLQHPNILGLFDSGAEAGFCYYVMPYVEGETLRERLEREGRFELPEAVAVATDLSAALSYAHSRGVVHRDLKPENVLFSAGKAMLADFGLARALSEGQRTITVAGMSLGTPAYMSPEQAQGAEGIDHRSDIYALGCIIFETVAGQPPFTGPGVGRIIQQHVQNPPPPVRQFRPDAPAALDAVLQKALAKDPAARFQSADDMLTSIRRVSGGDAETAPASGTPSAGSDRRLVYLMGGVAVLAILALLLVLLLR
jgi:serine/threonine-protein kinase